jgi:Rad3-related DNA helicase
MVSVDHFGQELRAQMACAAAYGATDILINGGELCRLFRGSVTALDACTRAMQAELKPGDIVIIEAGAGVGMTVRYLLPRASE